MTAYRWQTTRLSATPDAAWTAIGPTSGLAGAAWYRSLGEAWGVPLEVVTLRDGDTPVAVLPLVRGRGLHRQWTSATNEHVPSCAFPFSGDEATAAALLEQLFADADSVTLSRLSEESPLCQALVKAAERRGLPLVRTSQGTDCLLELDAPWPDVRKRLSSHNAKENERKRRQMEKSAPVRFDAVYGGDALDATLDECLALEAKGWKAAEGLPIVRDPPALRFYRALAHRAAADGTLALYTLRLAGQVIAFEYALKTATRIDVLKIAYDEEWAKQSPGGVLRLAVFEHELGRGFRGTYHIGSLSEWKKRWSPEVHSLCTLQIYGDGPRARALWAAGPLLRQTLDRSPRLRQAAIRTRDLARRLLARLR